MNSIDLSRPVRERVHIVEPAQASDSLGHIAERFKSAGLESLPVVHDGGVIGHVTQRALVNALAAGLESTSAVGSVLVTAVPVIGCNQSGAEALRMLTESGAPMLLVSDETDRVMGVLTAADLFVRQQDPPRPGTVGGMATPFGVYLTDGVLSAGAQGWALVATGVTLMSLHVISGMIALGVFDQPWVARAGISVATQEAMLATAWTGLFFLGMRLLPIAGIHAAEHMTVHAIERKEPLVPEIVARMPRVHPRCGTNIVAGVMIYLTIAQRDWFQDRELQLLVAAAAALILWRPLGSVLQKYVTTRPPTRQHIDMGIRAGQELLDKFAAKPHGRPNVSQRIASSGILHIMTGSMGLTIVLYVLSRYVPFLKFLQVYF